MKKKILLILALSLTLSACKKDEYVSQRHPDENKKSNPISASVNYKDKKNNETEKENTPSDSQKGSLEKVENEKNNSNDKNENEQNPKEENNQENAQGIFTVKDISNIRREMDTESEIVATVQPGVEIQRTEISGEWSKVSYGEYEGYILTELLENIE
ncbi:MAG: SH3 domain-containing protein, partial [Anaerococcus hydrogenalis]|nr:SH3 domain-containing protein [Anaerococcus hydrogenalis]